MNAKEKATLRKAVIQLHVDGGWEEGMDQLCQLAGLDREKGVIDDYYNDTRLRQNLRKAKDRGLRLFTGNG